MYKITSSERNNEKATQHETKALFYLLNYYDKKGDIQYIVIDFFNDVTGISSLENSCYDVQSKGEKNINPKKLGQYLVTLYKNFLSEFNFLEFILFIEGASSTIVKLIGNKKSFSYNDLDKKILSKVVQGLKEAANTYPDIDKKDVIESKINNFLTKVIFVISDKTEIDCIKDAVKLKPSAVVDNERIKRIFKKIRDIQSSKKNNCCEGKMIAKIGDFKSFDKFLAVDQIREFIFNDICFNNFVRRPSSIPSFFNSELMTVATDRRDEIMNACCQSIYLLLSDKNNREAYWALFSEVYNLLKRFPSYNINQIFDKVDSNKIIAVRFLDAVSCKYYIALVKEVLND